MTTAQMIFLYTAEDLNIGKAAKRAFVTQQCASKHIQNLEDKYGITLFNRKPSLTLTPAGICLQTSLRQIQLIEQNADSGIEEIRKGGVGKLTIGINPTRCRILIPPILERFTEQFPRVEVSLQFGDTIKNLQLLQQGKIDLVIGIGAKSSDIAHFSVIPLSKEQIFFLTTRPMIQKYCPDFYEYIDNQGEISLHALTNFPFCRNLAGSTLTRLVDTYLYQEQITLNTRYNISDYDVQFDLCIANIAAAFCPSMILNRIFTRDLDTASEKHPLIFPIKEIRDELSIDLVQNTYSFQPFFIKRFIQLLKEEIDHIQNDIGTYM